MKGTLREQPLAELIHEIRTTSLAGALHLTYERVKAVVYFDHGELLSASTNLRMHRFAECLRRWNVLPEDKSAVTMREGISDQELGALLVQMKALSTEELERLRVRQATEALRPLLLWISGEWRYESRARRVQNAETTIDALPLLMESARRLPPEFVAARCINDHAKLRLTNSSLAGIEILPSEAFVLSRLDAPLSVGELILVSELPRSETQRAIYALVLGGFVQCDAQGTVRCDVWPRVFSPEALAEAKAALSIGSESSKQPHTAVTMPDAGAQAGSGDDQQVAVDQLFARARGATWYEVLDVDARASSGEIKQAYYGLAKRLHPDRFHRGADEGLRDRIQSAFARIAQAYEALKDETQRIAYDAKLSKQAPSSAASPPMKRFDSRGANNSADDSAGVPLRGVQAAAASAQPTAEESFRQGLAMLKQGDHQQAAVHLSQAVRIDPKQPHYHATYGEALMLDARTRRQAEAEFLAAISLNQRNASYRVMLAELYLSVGLQRRAEGELRRALAIDPQHSAARRLSEQLAKPVKH